MHQEQSNSVDSRGKILNKKKVGSIMKKVIDFCTPEITLESASRMMVINDYSAIPVVNNKSECRVIGLITAQDISLRTLGRGLNPSKMRTEECMTTPAVTVLRDCGVDECLNLMKETNIEKVVVVDAEGRGLGLISLIDLVQIGS